MRKKGQRDKDKEREREMRKKTETWWIIDRDARETRMKDVKKKTEEMRKKTEKISKKRLTAGEDETERRGWGHRDDAEDEDIILGINDKEMRKERKRDEDEMTEGWGRRMKQWEEWDKQQ
jgi:hypothetical protein